MARRQRLAECETQGCGRALRNDSDTFCWACWEALPGPMKRDFAEAARAKRRALAAVRRGRGWPTLERTIGRFIDSRDACRAFLRGRAA